MDREDILLIIAIVGPFLGAAIGGGSVWFVLGRFVRDMLKNIPVQNQIEARLTENGMIQVVNDLSKTFGKVVSDVGRYIPLEAIQPLLDAAKFGQIVSDGQPNIIPPGEIGDVA